MNLPPAVARWLVVLFFLDLAGPVKSLSAAPPLATDLLEHPWEYDPSINGESSEYAAYYVSQAALQLGEPYWAKTYPPMLARVLSVQRPNGSWPPSPHARVFGENYTTAMYVLTLGAPLQLLPIYQP